MGWFAVWLAGLPPSPQVAVGYSVVAVIVCKAIGSRLPRRFRSSVADAYYGSGRLAIVHPSAGAETLPVEAWFG